MKRRQAAEEHGGGGHDGTGSMRWLLTYADLITLLMAFFVIMFAMSRVDQEKFAALARSLQLALSNRDSIIDLEAQREVSKGEKEAQGEAPREDEDDLQRLYGELRAYVEAAGLSDRVEVFSLPDGIVVSFMDTVLFDLGRAELRPEARDTLAQIARFLARDRHHVNVQGFTDDLPIHNREFRSNWELSAARALAVVHFLTEAQGLDPRRFSATGFGEYHPLVPNDSEANRARNRRVDLVILREPLVAR